MGEMEASRSEHTTAVDEEKVVVDRCFCYDIYYKRVRVGTGISCACNGLGGGGRGGRCQWGGNILVGGWEAKREEVQWVCWKIKYLATSEECISV